MDNSRLISTNKIATRDRWLDISRGILIILVVFGHSRGGLHWQLKGAVDYVYLFHMPAFFIISGYLYKPVKNDKEYKNFIIKRAKRLLIPYFSYLIVLNGIKDIQLLIYSKLPFGYYTKDVIHALYGGLYLNESSGILWFLTCLFFVELFWVTVDYKIVSNKIKVFFVLFFYLLAHINSIYFPNIRLPLAIDISFITLAYYYFGVYSKNLIQNKKLFVISIVMSIFFLIANKLRLTNFGIELWRHHYTNLILDFIVPIAFSIILFNICKYIANFKITNIFSFLGKITLPIMCLHLISNATVLNIFNYEPFLYHSLYYMIFVLIGITIPTLITKCILEKNKILSKLFLGKIY